MRGTDAFRNHCSTVVVTLVIGLLAAGAAVAQDGAINQCPPVNWPPPPPDGPVNDRPAAVLGRLDIDGDGAPDRAPDSDGDGLPDNWETGGSESLSNDESLNSDGEGPDRFVRFSAPTAIGVGTPPVFVFSRLGVTTRANLYDTDSDGLSDFIEVFGLKFIDDNNNGILDFSFKDANGNGQWDPGEEDPGSEWLDLNGDGLPSIGEYPLPNIDPSLNRQNDFDGFVFTDPTLFDTDGDGICDSSDPDPLINPETFGVPGSTFVRVRTLPEDEDLDNDGLGNGSDLGNDLERIIDQPSDIDELIELFRPDRIFTSRNPDVRCSTPTMPESLIEDMLAVDWNGDGLFRTTDAIGFLRNVTEECLVNEWVRQYFGEPTNPRDIFERYFMVDQDKLFAENPALIGGTCEFAREPSGPTVDPCTQATEYAQRGLGLGLQDLLRPSLTAVTPFLPDVRVWTILYAWRMPGFDIDGNGYIGSPEASFTLDDRHPFKSQPSPLQNLGLDVDGVIVLPGCGNVGLVSTLATLLVMTLAVVAMPRLRGRR